MTINDAEFLSKLIDLLNRHDIRYCVIGGQAVNAYAEPLVGLDVDLVVAGDDLGRAADLMSSRFELKRTPHSLSVSSPNSELRVKVQLDPRYAEFLERAEEAEVLGLTLPVASKEDVLQGQIWVTLDASRQTTKRENDLEDIARLIEADPDLREQLPPEVLDRLSG